jgi:hypothetical protein
MVEIVVTPPPSTTVTVVPSVNPTTSPAEVAVYTGQPGPKGETGATGATGATGPQGPPGPTPTIAYTHTQNAVSSTWTITHNLGFYPNVVTLDSAGTIIEGGIAFDSVNQITVSFAIATSGIAHLS